MTPQIKKNVFTSPSQNTELDCYQLQNPFENEIRIKDALV